MNLSAVEILLGFTGTAVTATLTFLAARLQSKRAYRATSEQTRSNEIGAVLQSWQGMNAAMQTRIDRLEASNAQLHKSNEDCSKRLDIAEEEIHQAGTELSILRRRLTEWAIFYHDLVVRWEWHRQQPNPPSSPMDRNNHDNAY